MNNHIDLRLETWNTIHSWFIVLNDKDENKFDSSLINLLDLEYNKYIKKFHNLFIHIHLTLNDIGYIFPLIENKPYKIEYMNNLQYSTYTLNLSFLEDMKNYIPLPKKIKRNRAIITIGVNDINELKTTLENIFVNFYIEHS